MKRIILASTFAGMYTLFWRWYTGNQKPLTPAEIENYMQRLAEIDGAEPAVIERIRAFLQNDTGRGFVMVNLIKLHDQPKPVANAEKPLPETSAALLNRYTSVFLPAIFKRACHPVLVGKVAAEAVELWGIPGGEEWTSVGLIRYRSRRDMIESATAPNFQEIHGFKIAAIEKTIAVPADPFFHLGEPRLVVGLLAILGALVTDTFIKRKSTK